MYEKDLKKSIKKKYRNINRFCKLAKISYHTFHHMLREPDEDKRVENIKQLTSTMLLVKDSCLPGEISEQLRNKIKVEIYSRYKNVSQFAKISGISNMTISMTISGKCFKITDTTKKICSLLNININEFTE